jgi:teichuronic acid exporter
MTTQAGPGHLDRSLARAVAWNAAARWIAQVLSWLSTIVVARLLTPYDYGIIAMASLYLNLAMYLSQAGISNAIIALRN